MAGGIGSRFWPFSRTALPKQFHDVVGYYNRFDIFDLRVNRRRLSPASFSNDPVLTPGATGSFRDDEAGPRATTRTEF